MKNSHAQIHILDEAGNPLNNSETAPLLKSFDHFAK
jgi:hypothetical protein